MFIIFKIFFKTYTFFFSESDDDEILPLENKEPTVRVLCESNQRLPDILQNSYDIINTKADGLCFWYSIGHANRYLDHNSPTFSTNLAKECFDLRERVLNFVLNNEHTLEPFFHVHPEYSYSDTVKILSRNSKPYLYTTSAIVLFTSIVLNRPIHVYQGFVTHDYVITSTSKSYYLLEKTIFHSTDTKLFTIPNHFKKSCTYNGAKSTNSPIRIYMANKHYESMKLKPNCPTYPPFVSAFKYEFQYYNDDKNKIIKL